MIVCDICRKKANYKVSVTQDGQSFDFCKEHYDKVIGYINSLSTANTKVSIPKQGRKNKAVI